jgi:hypothetical protein
LVPAHGAGDPAPRITGIGLIPCFSFEQLERTKPFSAKVVSSEAGLRKAPVDSATGRIRPGARPAPYVLIYLLKADGARSAVYQEHANSNEVAFASQLETGHEYRLPDAFEAWLEKR